MPLSKNIWYFCGMCAIATISYAVFGSKIWTYLDELPRRPIQIEKLCDNILQNITNGKWTRKIDLMDNKLNHDYRSLVVEEEKFDAHMNEFRIRRGVHVRLWRDDHKCGINNIQQKPNGSNWAGSIGAWCDAKSDKPCCSDENAGTCGLECNCTNCIDMRSKKHAEFSDWVPTDSRCRVRNYTAERGCDVIKRFSEIVFVGDSFVRKMSRGFILLLRSDPNFGAISKIHDEKRKKLCVGVEQFYWSQCSFASGNFKELMQDGSPLCGADLEKFSVYSYLRNSYAKQYFDLVKRLAGKERTVVLLGVGGHDGCHSKSTWEKYVWPPMKYLDEFYKAQNLSNELRWPRIVFMFSDTPDVLKSRDFRAANGKVPCYKFADEMTKLCHAHGISVLDFRKLTTGVHSFDGTHYGIGVNLMKNQLLLNYLDFISSDDSWNRRTDYGL